MKVRSCHRWRAGRLRSAIVVAVLVLVAGATLGLTACGESDSSSSTTTGILRVAANGDFETGWDIRAAAPPVGEYMANMYETLLRLNPEGSAEPYEPVLATSWESSSDGLVWTFHLREGVVFHDGEQFNAQAVKYALETTMKLGKGSSYILAPIRSIEVVDDYTVKFQLSQSVPLERILGSEYGAYIFSPATKGIKAKAWLGHDYGTGPYKVESAKAGEEYVFVHDPNYWGGWGDGQYKKVVVQVVKDAGTQRQLLEAGQVDFVDLVDRDSIEAMESSSTVSVASFLFVPITPLGPRLIQPAQ